jgi:hypothetical protein
MGSDWRRSFLFIIPVRSPDHWSSRKVLEPLCETLSFLSDDDYAFEFERATNPPPLERYLDLGGDEPAAFTPDEVVLFSGGLDSLGGTIEELSSSAKRIALGQSPVFAQDFRASKADRGRAKESISKATYACPCPCNQARDASGPRVFAAIAVLSVRCACMRCRSAFRKLTDSILRKRNG